MDDPPLPSKKITPQLSPMRDLSMLSQSIADILDARILELELNSADDPPKENRSGELARRAKSERTVAMRREQLQLQAEAEEAEQHQQQAAADGSEQQQEVRRLPSLTMHEGELVDIGTLLDPALASPRPAPPGQPPQHEPPPPRRARARSAHAAHRSGRIPLALDVPFGQVSVERAAVGLCSSGELYAGEWRGDRVAVKLLPADSPPLQLRRLKQETNVLLNLRPHPHIVRLLGFSTAPFALLLEAYPGCTLEALTRRPAPALGLPEALRVARALAAALAHLHAHGVVHRDVAARNVWVAPAAPAARLRLADFGLARRLADGAADPRHTASNPGPVKWLAPECLLQSVYSAKSDVFAWGVCVWEVLAQSEPHAALSAAELVQHVQAHRLPTLAVPAGVPPPLHSLLHDCWRSAPAARPLAAELDARCQLVQDALALLLPA